MADSVTEQATGVVVLGAGIVGVSTAYALRERGLVVTLVDRKAPGEETSYGNAGILSSGSILPLNKPSLLTSLPSYLANQNPALRWSPAPLHATIESRSCSSRRARARSERSEPRGQGPL